MPTLDPLFRLLVRSLEAHAPARLHQPIAVNELMDAVLPYRLVRRELSVDTSEDYETLLLRLVAGEGGFLQAEPAAREAFEAELRKPLPDLALIRVYGDTHVVLRTEPMAEALGAPAPELRYAPPGQQPSGPAPAMQVETPRPPRPEANAIAPDVDDGEDEEDEEDEPAAEEPTPDGEPGGASAIPDTPRGPNRCPFCGGLLPTRIIINFCPHCGMGQDVGTCRACGADMDVGWRYCVHCGEEARGVA